MEPLMYLLFILADRDWLAGCSNCPSLWLILICGIVWHVGYYYYMQCFLLPLLGDLPGRRGS